MYQIEQQGIYKIAMLVLPNRRSLLNKTVHSYFLFAKVSTNVLIVAGANNEQCGRHDSLRLNASRGRGYIASSVTSDTNLGSYR